MSFVFRNKKSAREAPKGLLRLLFFFEICAAMGAGFARELPAPEAAAFRLSAGLKFPFADFCCRVYGNYACTAIRRS
jgi:hypothetical protein